MAIMNVQTERCKLKYSKLSSTYERGHVNLVFLGFSYHSQDDCFKFHQFPYEFHNDITAELYPMCKYNISSLSLHQLIDIYVSLFPGYSKYRANEHEWTDITVVGLRLSLSEPGTHILFMLASQKFPEFLLSPLVTSSSVILVYLTCT